MAQLRKNMAQPWEGWGQNKSLGKRKTETMRGKICFSCQRASETYKIACGAQQYYNTNVT